MRAHENPFRTSRTEALPFRGPVPRANLMQRVAALGYRGAIVGREGSGKSTLLRELESELADGGLDPDLVRFDDGALLRRRKPETILMIDGAEKLPWILHLVLALTAPRLIVTAHRRREGLPVLIECQASPALMMELVTELAGPDAALLARARQLFGENHGNVRAVFGALYDLLGETS